MDEQHQLVRHQGPGEPARALRRQDISARQARRLQHRRLGQPQEDQNCSEALACTFIACDEKGNPVESDIRFSTDVKWSTTGASGTYDIQSIAAHEIGHVLQFDHVTNSSKDDHTILMWPYMDSADTSGRKLGRGDALENNSHY